MPLRDYLYVDEKRLNSYEAQIGSPVTFDKVPIWKLMFSVVGPKVEGEQRREGRRREHEEKIELLLDYLRHKKQLAEGRIADRSYHNKNFLFRLEHCKAVRIELPEVERTKGVSSVLILWMTETLTETLSDTESEVSSRLFLLQDDGHRDDSESNNARSAFSSLLGLYEHGGSLSQASDKQYRHKRSKEVSGKLLRQGLRPSESRMWRGLPGQGQRLDDIEWVATETERIIDAERPLLNPTSEELKKDFAVNPLGVLRTLRAEGFSWQYVETLYRVRDVHLENAEKPIIVTFAYPIFIAR